MNSLLLTTMLFVLVLTPSTAVSSQYEIQAIAVEGDPAPGAGGDVYGGFGLGMTASDRIPFTAKLSPGASSFDSLFRWSGGVSTLLRRAGDPAPASIGGTYSSFASPSESSDGTLVFRAGVFYGGTTYGLGVFKYGPAGDEALVLIGDPAPGTGGGVLSSCNLSDSNSSGDFLLRCAITGGTITWGVFLYSGGVLSPVLKGGDPSPVNGTIFDTSSGFGRARINDAGQIALRALDSVGEMVLLISEGVTTVVAYEGDAAPDSDGGYFAPETSGYTFWDIELRESGAVVFVASLDSCLTPPDPPYSPAEFYLCSVYEYENGSLTKIVRSGDPGFPSTVWGTGDRISEVDVLGTTGTLFEAGGYVQRVAQYGELVEVFDAEDKQSTGYPSLIVESMSTNRVGQIMARAHLNLGGPPFTGIFVATSTQAVPTQASPAIPILILFLMLLGVSRLGRLRDRAS